MDEIIPEPLGGAHSDPMGAFPAIKEAIMRNYHQCALYPKPHYYFLSEAVNRSTALRGRPCYRAVCEVPLRSFQPTARECLHLNLHGLVRGTFAQLMPSCTAVR